MAQPTPPSPALAELSPPSDELARAMAAAATAPDKPELWDAVERLAADAQAPEHVARLYQAVLERPLPREVGLTLCERAVGFFGEWFEDSKDAERALRRALEIDPAATWAFRRLTMLFTVDRRWNDLLALYDRVLVDTTDRDRRIELYGEAAQVAKDLAGRAERAIDYLEALGRLTPLDPAAVASLERLLDREGRYRELVTLWSGQLPSLEHAEARARRAQIAACMLDRLESPGEALEAVEGLLLDPVSAPPAIALLERIFVFPGSPPAVRERAREELRRHYAASGRVGEIIRVLRTALETADVAGQVDLHHDIAELLIEQDRLAEALDHYAELCWLDPLALPAFQRLRELAELTSRLDRQAEALMRAADACEAAGAEAPLRARGVALLLEAATVRRDELDDARGATALYGRLFHMESGVDAVTELEVCRRLDELLRAAPPGTERLDVLERRASLEPSTRSRRILLAEAARLADALGDADRALAAWALVLTGDPADGEAHEASLALLDREQRWETLIVALGRAADASGSVEVARGHRVRAAQVHAERLHDVAPAIAEWQAIERAFGASDETVDALARLHAEAERWDELSAVLERGIGAATEPARRIRLTHELGEALRLRHSEPSRALDCYKAVLAEQPGHAGARAGVTALLGELGGGGEGADVPSLRRVALGVLLEAFAATGDWSGRLSLLEHRLEDAGDDEVRSALLREAADLQEERAGDSEAALRALSRALPLVPGDLEIERRILRLAAATGGWATAARAFGDAIATSEPGPRAAELQLQRGKILEDALDDRPAALLAYGGALDLLPDRLDAARAVVRVATREGHWDVAARTLVASARARGALDEELLALLEAAARSGEARWDVAATELAVAVALESALSPTIAVALEQRIAEWHRSFRGDFTAAEDALLRALGHGGELVPTLQLLAEVQRHAPGRNLVDTLLRLADEKVHALGALHEAATVAVEVLHDEALARTILERLLGEVAAELRARAQEEAARLADDGEPPAASPSSAFAPESGWSAPESRAGNLALDERASFAIRELVRLATAKGDHRRAIGILVEAADLPLGEEMARERLHEASAIAEVDLGDHERAVALYRRILAGAPGDARALARLGALFARDDRLDDLLALRRHELSLAGAASARIPLRLELAALLGRSGDAAGRIAALRENLDDEAAHDESLEQLGLLLEAESKHAELADVLEQEAAKVEAAGDAPRAAELWTRASELAETRLGSVVRALAARTRAVAFAPTVASFDALARLSAACGEHEAAVSWLDLRLAALDPAAEDERVATLGRLADAHVGAGRPDTARACLERGLAEHPSAVALREPLRRLYRNAGAWEPLVGLLTDPREPPRVDHLREAAEVCTRKLGSFERAIPILDAMVALAGTDRAGRLALAAALRGTGRFDRARVILASLLDEYGRRRPPERADVHFELAQVAGEAGDVAEATRQLEAAIGVNPEHPGALKALGRLYRTSGELERAERIYGALLLLAMRQRPARRNEDTTDSDRPAHSEVMVSLHWVLGDLGQKQRSDEMLASAFDAARRSEFEARRLEEALREEGDHALLLRAMETRLARADLDRVTRASVLSDLAQVLEGPLARPADALGALLEALALDPASITLHERAVAAARRAGDVRRYTEALAPIAERAVADGRSSLGATLFSSLGDLEERDLDDPAVALATYLRAEALGAEGLPIWRAIARVAGATGETAPHIRALRQLVFAGEGGDPAAQTEDIYRLAELELATPAEVTPGLGTLEWALSREARYDRAGKMLRTAGEVGVDSAVLAMYERVARASGDSAMLLDALDRASWVPGAGMDVLREAVELAGASGQSDRAETLLLRAVELGEAGTNGLSEAVWAFVALAERRLGASDPAAAFDLLGRAVDAAEHDEALELTRRRVALAVAPLADPRRAAEAYEQILERDRHDREVWQPLLELYRGLGDLEVLEAKLRMAIECAFDPALRVDLRMERAKLLVGARPEDAIAELTEVLQENEEHDEAAALLTRLHEVGGREEALVEILERRLAVARGRADLPAVVELSLRLAGLSAGPRPAQAVELLRSALDSAPTSVPVLEALLALFAGGSHLEDRADVLERLVELDHGQAAVERALALAALRQELGDEDGMARGLDLGFRASPSSSALRERLVDFYTSHERWDQLAGMLAFEGAAIEGPLGVARLREAASLHLDRLGQPREAAAALGAASARTPGDLDLLVHHARTLALSGDRGTARSRVAEALDRPDFPERARRITLLKLRAELLTEPEELDRATADLEAAYLLDRSAAAAELIACLERRRQLPAGPGDREVVLRLAEILVDAGRVDRTREVLREWIDTVPADLGVVRVAAEIDAYAGRWDGAMELCERLVELEQGPAKVDAALLLAAASAQAGYALDARPMLEQVLLANPSDARLREPLRRIYEELGAHRELAQLSLLEAEAAADANERFAALRRAGGLLIESVGDGAAATAPLEAAHELRPKDHEVLVLLSDAYIWTSRLEEAANLLDAAIAAQKGRRSREVSMLQQRMGDIARAVGDRSNEMAWLNAACESDGQNGAAAAKLADVATELGQLEVAMKALKAITLMKAPKPMSRAMAYLRQAVLAQHQGDVRKATMLAKKALAEDATLTEAGTFLEQLTA